MLWNPKSIWHRLAAAISCCQCQVLAQAFYEGKFAGLQVPVVPVTDTRDGGHAMVPG